MSKDRVGAGLGVDRQRADCEELADRLGWTVVGHHSDNDLSAYSGKPRPGYAALLADLDSGRADAVIVWHTDRLHRRPTELEDYIAVCERRNVTTQTVRAGPLDLATPSGRMIARQLGVVARYEVEHMIERSQRAKSQAAAAGKWLGGRRPFGYEVDGVTVRESEATVVREVADSLLAGLSLRSIAADLTRRGRTSSTGKVWTGKDLRTVMLRARNAGLMEHRGEILGQAEWPPLLSEDTWRGVRALLTDDRRRTTPGNARRWLGGGLYRCGVCGNTLRASTSGSGRNNGGPAYRCEESAHVVRSAKALDEFTSKLVVARLAEPDAASLGERPESDISSVHVERLVVQARMDELVDLHSEGSIDGRGLKRGTQRLASQMADLELRLSAAASGAVLHNVAGPDASARWKTLDISRQRTVLDALMVVTVHPSRKGRPRGWKPGSSYFDYNTIEVTWK